MVTDSAEVPESIPINVPYCGKCQEICQFNGINILPEAALTFPELAVGAVREMKIPMGIVINRSHPEDGQIHGFAKRGPSRLV